MSAAFTAREKLACVERELWWRRSVYPRRVADGKMTVSAKDREIALMDAIASDYRHLAATEKNGSDLFGGAPIANDRGAEPLGDIVHRVLTDIEAGLEEEVRSAKRAVAHGEELLSRVRSLDTTIRQPFQDAAE